VPEPPSPSHDAVQRGLKRIYELAPQMQLYHRINSAHVWQPFIMRAALPNMRRERLHTDAWGLRRSIGRDNSELTVESVAADEPVDLFLGGSFCFGVGASSDAGTLPSVVARAIGRTALNMGGYYQTLPQHFIQFMFFFSRFRRIRNVVLAGFNEIYNFHACDAVFRPYGTFLFNDAFLKATNAPFTAAKKATIYGPQDRAFVPLTRRDENAEQERAALNDSIRNVLTTWQRLVESMGARLIVMVQPTPGLQMRDLSPEEVELLAHYDAAWHIVPDVAAAVADHKTWHRRDMEAMAKEIGFTYVDINDRFGAALAGKWLFVDRAHMTDLGYRSVAERLIPHLQK
jgi:hypothetical protein